MAVLGCHQNEARERDRFIEVSKVRKEMVEERVARFDLEHQLQQSSAVRATHMGRYSTSEDMTELSFELSISKPSEAASSHNQPLNLGINTETKDVVVSLLD